ncbi:thiol reductant ABC exporter subunit CydD [Moraxella sp. RCAD0137]|uniref:thiol reductant ABC exporter subunit CydD n=1 Tax=Moraxella sp. RCAD0137 TaxID=1775913 RepID=UPI001D0D101E|nr:thiol reductant ABC exporter subunit CydD [Moraxella sp. RCAD0137]
MPDHIAAYIKVEKKPHFGDNSLFVDEITIMTAKTHPPKIQNQVAQTHATQPKAVKSKATKAKKPRQSQEDIAANQFLKSFFKPYKNRLNLARVCDVIMVLLLMVQAWILVLIFDGWLLPFLPQFANHDAMATSILPVYLVALVGVMALRAFVAYIKDVQLSRVGVHAAGRARSLLLTKLGEMGLARRFFGPDGALASKIIDEPEHLVGYARFEVQKTTAVLTPILLAICIAFFNGTAALILLMTAPLVPIFMALIGVATSRKSREQMDAMAQLGGRFFDWIRGINTLSRVGAVDIAVSDIANSSENYRKKTMAVLRIAFLNSAVLEFFSALSIALVAVYLGFGLIGILPWRAGEVITNYGAALMILLLVPEFYAPLRRLGAEYHIKGQAVGAAKAMVAMLDFKQPQSGTKQLDITGAAGFELQKVAAFGEDGRIRLAPTTLSFAAGKSTLLRGESGSGKSTVLQILLGFGQYTGTIAIKDAAGCHDYHTLDLTYLRRQFGYLAQTPALLPISIADNLRLAKPDASEDELIDVLQAVGLWPLIKQLPAQMQAVLGERGSGLSGGQAHRLAIAQLLLQDAKVWLLDEPTEHLDADTAAAITALLFELSQDKTVIWISHEEGMEAKFDAVYQLGVSNENQ